MLLLNFKIVIKLKCQKKDSKCISSLSKSPYGQTFITESLRGIFSAIMI